MSVAKVIETTTSTKSFEDAIEKGIARADKTLKNEGAWIKEQKVIVTDGKIKGFRQHVGDFRARRRHVDLATVLTTVLLRVCNAPGISATCQGLHLA